MKSLSVQFAEACDALRKHGKNAIADNLVATQVSLEVKLQEAEDVLKELGVTKVSTTVRPKNVRKNLGVDTRAVVESIRDSGTHVSDDKHKQSIYECFCKAGYSEVEAKLMADIDDKQVREAINHGKTAEQFLTEVILQEARNGVL